MIHIDSRLRGGLGIHTDPSIAALSRRTSGDPRVRVGILDGLADCAHPTFQGVVMEILSSPGTSSANVNLTGPAGKHGTHVTSIIVGQSGLAPRCRALLRPIFSDGPDGQLLPCNVRELAAAIVQAASAGCQIINVSAGAPLDPDLAPTCLAEAVLFCERQECLLVAAAGNDGCANCLHLPGGLRSRAVLAVGAMDAAGVPLEFSNWGASYGEQGLLAPGRDIVGAVSPNFWEARTGTSYATAVVSGICGLLLSLQLEAGERPRPLAVREALLATALDCRRQPVPDCSRLLAGRLYLPAAISALNIDKGDLTVSEPVGSPISAVESHSMESNSAEATAAVQGSANTVVVPRDYLGELAGSGDCPATSGESAGVARCAAVRPSSLDANPVLPSGCGCGGKVGPRQLVYVVGNRLEYDFGTRVRQESLEDNFRAGLLDEQYRSLQYKPNLLRYLLGWDGQTGTGHQEAGSTPVGGLGARGHLFDAKSVHWVLYQDDCPVYAIAPQGSFADVAYKELIYFFIENQGIALADFGIPADCINQYLECHGGLNDPLDPGDSAPVAEIGKSRRSRDQVEAKSSKQEEAHADDVAASVGSLLMEEPNRVARIAIAGQVVGKAVLSTGETVEVVAPEMRGTAAWNTRRLLEVLSQYPLPQPQTAEALVSRIVATLYEATRNPGKTPEDRAMNYAATAALRFIRPFFRPGPFTNMLGGLENVAIEGVNVRRSGCQRTGMEFDVDLSFYSFENTLRGLVTLTTTVDVSDTVPVALGNLRFSTRR